MLVEKTTEHEAAETALAAAEARFTTARTAHAAAAGKLQEAMRTKADLLAKSAAGEMVAAKDMLETERKCRDAETLERFAATALEGAQTALTAGRAAFRPLAQQWFGRRYAALMQARASLAREADEALEVAKAKLAEIDTLRGAVSALRLEANAQIPDADRLPTDFLPIPAGAAGFQVVIKAWRGMSDREFQSFARALGHG